MFEVIKQTFEDIRNAIIEKGVDVDYCDSPTTYAKKILSIPQEGGVSMLLIPVFKSSTNRPERPSAQMSASDPTGFPEGWGTPDGLTGNIWMSYTLVGNSYVYIPGTEPLLMSGKSGSSEITKTFTIFAELSSSTLDIPTPIGGTGDVDNDRLVGEIRSELPNGNYVLWSTKNVHVDGLYTYISFGTFSSNGNIVGSWSVPFCTNTAKNGRDGADSMDKEYIYKRVGSLEEFYELQNTPLENNPDESDFVPSGWEDQPLGIDGDEWIIEACSTRKLDHDTSKWEDFTTPVIWSIWGKQGKDGDGIEYIFRVAGDGEYTKTNEGKYVLNRTYWPPQSEDDLLDNLPDQSMADAIKELFQEDEFIPNDKVAAYGGDFNWSDDPFSINEQTPMQFCSKRKYDGDTKKWGYFSEPVLWSKADYADSSVFTAFAFTRTDLNIAGYIPEGGNAASPVPTATYRIDPQTEEKIVVNNVTWHDTVPSGAGQVGMTTRTFGHPDLEARGGTSPQRLSDSVNFQVEYSNDYPWATHPALPKLDSDPSFIDPSSSEGVNEQAWRTYCANHNLGTWNDTITEPTYMATCSKGGDGWSNGTVAKIKGEKGDPGRGLQSVTHWYKVSDRSSGLPAPAVGEETANGWYSSSIPTLSAEQPYLWCFIRTIYSDNTVTTDGPFIVRYFNAAAAVSYDEIRTYVEQQVAANIRAYENRLATVEATDALIKTNKEHGLIELLTQFRDGDQTSFADVVANAAESTIKLMAAARVNEGLSGSGITIDGLAARLNASATTHDINGAIADARTEGQAGDEAAITSAVSRGQQVGVNTTDGSILPYNGENSKTGYELKYVASEMSAIKLTSNKIDLVVGDNNGYLAALNIIGKSTLKKGENGVLVPETPNADGTAKEGSIIVLDANQVGINGTLMSNLLEANAAKINELVVGDLSVAGKLKTTGGNGTVNTLIEGGSMKIYLGPIIESEPNVNRRVEFGTDGNNDIVLKFYDANGTLLYDLGPNGISLLGSSGVYPETGTPQIGYKHNTLPSAGSTYYQSNGTQTFLNQYSCARRTVLNSVEYYYNGSGHNSASPYDGKYYVGQWRTPENGYYVIENLAGPDARPSRVLIMQTYNGSVSTGHMDLIIDEEAGTSGVIQEIKGD